MRKVPTLFRRDPEDMRRGHAERDVLASIVRDLATAEDLGCDHGGVPFCCLCGNATDGPPPKHRESCPHRRAVEWIQAEDSE